MWFYRLVCVDSQTDLCGFTGWFFVDSQTGLCICCSDIC